MNRGEAVIPPSIHPQKPPSQTLGLQGAPPPRLRDRFFDFKYKGNVSKIDIKNILRSRQDSNLRGETPLDFKSNALTTRPRLHNSDKFFFLANW